MPNNPVNPLAAGRFIIGVFGFVFAGIGVTVLGFLWGVMPGLPDEVPVFFRIFASFIAIAFVAVGGTMGVAAIRNLSGLPPQPPLVPPAFPSPPTASAQPETGGYVCPHCGAPLADKADVSPLGDVKCPFCNTWFNIHQRHAEAP
jgi:hypothetical protein